MTLEQPAMRHYKAVMVADADFESAGEEPYCGLSGRIGYGAWLSLIRRQADESAVEMGSNCNQITFMIDDEGVICGFGQLRPIDTFDVLTWAGHIGYSVPPSLRGRGYATLLLQMLLQRAYARGMEKVLLTCDVDNYASQRVIEKCGGKFEGLYTDQGYNKRRYWFKKEDVLHD